MKQIEKNSDGVTLHFGIWTGRKEMADEIRFMFGQCDKFWDDEDSMVHIWMKNGEYIGIGEGDKIPRLNFSNVEKASYSNCSGECFYGDFEIVQNDNGSWIVQER